VTESLDAYKFNEAANTLYNFVWHEFCDWYLELIKPNLYGKVALYNSNTTKEVLNNTLTDILKLLHPIMPFITEEIYQKLPHCPSTDPHSAADKGESRESIMVSAFPVYNAAQVDEKSEAGMDMIMGIIDVIRNIRGETGIAPNVKVEAMIRANGNQSLLEEYGYYIKELAKVGELVFISGEAPEKSAVGIYKGVEIFVPLKDLIDAPKELARIDKELIKIEEEMARVFHKLNNASFREKAPPDVIKKNELNYNILREKKDKLTESRKVLEGLAGK
jgi:valyl-tRNA synthetase